jgi:hypothetical protein
VVGADRLPAGGAADFVDGQQSANRIVPELQNLREGAIIRLAPEPGPFFEVALVEPENTLVLHALVDGPSDGRPAGTHYANVSWAFVLDGQPDGSTRLIVRQRLDYFPRPENTLLWRVITEPLNFVMERKMLLGIRLRSEIAANLDPAAAPAD